MGNTPTIRLARAEDAAGIIQRASDAQLGYADFLDLALGEEAAAREDRRFASSLRQAGLPHHKTLDDFDFAFQPGLDARKVRDLAALTFTARAGNIAFLGPPGTGKTHLACAIAVSAVSAGHSAYFTTLDDMVRKLRTADDAGDLNRQMRPYLSRSVLIIDEVGYLPMDRRDANLVFQVFARRYEKGSVIITSNKAFTEWGQVFTDEVLATAILDRFLHHCDVISIDGPSWRMKNQALPASPDKTVP